MERATCRIPLTPLRDEPDDAAEQHTQVLLGDRVDVLGGADGWLRVRVPDGYEGWLRAAAVGPPDERAPAHVVVEPEADGRFLGTWLPEPAAATEALDEARAVASGDAVVAVARRFCGVPYEWGGVTVRGIDCSGLVQAVHRRFGLLLPRDADDQEAAGTEVPAHEPRRAGDLLCFGDHVAICVDAVSIVHASGPAGRTLEEPLPPRLATRIRVVRRVYAAPAG